MPVDYDVREIRLPDGLIATAEISDDGHRVRVVFPYHMEAVKAVKKVPGARFVPPNNGGPMRMIPRELTTMRMLRESFGENLQLGPKLIKWGKEAVRVEKELSGRGGGGGGA